MRKIIPGLMTDKSKASVLSARGTDLIKGIKVEHLDRLNKQTRLKYTVGQDQMEQFPPNSSA